MTSSTIIEALTSRELLSLLDHVCSARRVTRDELCGRARTKNIALARQELWWHLRCHPGMSYDEIARLFGRNRTTVMSGVRSYLRATAVATAAATADSTIAA